MVYIQKYDKYEITQRNKAVINMLSSVLDDDKTRSKTAQSMEKLNNELKNQENKNQDNKVANVSDNSLSGESTPDKDTPEEIRKRSERKVKMIDQLNSVYSAESLMSLLPVRSSSCRDGAAAQRRCRGGIGMRHAGCAGG